MNKINLLQSFSPIILLILLLSVNVLEFGNDSISGPNQIALLFSAALACLIALKKNISWEEIFKSISSGNNSGTLISSIDKTKTSAGSRLLKKIISRPLTNINKINKRLDRIEELNENFVQNFKKNE